MIREPKFRRDSNPCQQRQMFPGNLSSKYLAASIKLFKIAQAGVESGIFWFFFNFSPKSIALDP